MEELTKETAKKLMEIKGETRGVSIMGDLEYILYKEGEEGLRKVEQELEKLGYPIKYKEMNGMALYPIGLEALTFLVFKKLFNFDREEFIKMGEFNSKVSLVVKLFMKYFVSLEVIAKHASKFWRRYYTTGDMKVTEINKEKKYIVVRVENFEHHPFHCLTVEGYLISIIKMVLGKPVSCEETKCVYRGDKYHEYIVKWE